MTPLTPDKSRYTLWKQVQNRVVSVRALYSTGWSHVEFIQDWIDRWVEGLPWSECG